MIFQAISFILLVSYPPQALAKEVVIEKGQSIYKIDIPENYEYHPKFFGLENVVMSKPDPELGTTSLSITVTGIESSELNSRELANSQKDYQTGRLKYLQERGLELIEFIPYELKKSPEQYQIHSVGVIYTNKKVVTVERSYMIECPKSFIHAKVLGNGGLMENLKSIKSKNFKTSALNDLEKVILALRCQTKK
jgi:hypothetical protein